MNNVYAFIVGIEKYKQPGWDVLGPCANALAIAEWCIASKVPPGNIFLFLAPLDVPSGEALTTRELITQIKANGTTVNESTTGIQSIFFGVRNCLWIVPHNRGCSSIGQGTASAITTEPEF